VTGGPGRAPAGTHYGTLVLILVAAAALRVWGIGFGLPLTAAHPDESRVSAEAIEIASGTLRPSFFNYPTLFMYALGAADRAYCGARAASGGASSTADCLGRWRVEHEPFFILARLLSAAAGTITVFLVYVLGARLFERMTGLAAAALAGVAFLHVRDSHFGVTDAAMTMMTVLAAVMIVRAHDRAAAAGDGARAFALAGFVAGLAASTKYNALIVAATAAVSIALLWQAESTTGGRHARALRRAGACGAALAAGFFAGTPYALVEPARFWRDASGEALHLQVGHAINLGVGWGYHFSVTLRHGLTIPLLAGGLAGAAWMAWTRPQRAALLLAFPLVYYGVAGHGYTVFARYMVPVVPFLALAAGWLAASLARAAGARVSRLPPALACVGLVTAFGAASAIKAVQLDRLLSRTDSRVLAADWLMAHAIPPESIYISGSRYGRPDVGRRLPVQPYTIVELRDGVFRDGSGAAIDRPDWIVVQESPLRMYSSVPPEVIAQLADYRLVQTFRAFDPGAPQVYDQQDAFFVPLSGFDGVGRPGPSFGIYRRGR
jgi:dolichyl-phosphate-mannose-protein mannosyltransferase